MLRECTLEFLICTTECCSKVIVLFISSMGIFDQLFERKKSRTKVENFMTPSAMLLARKRLFYQFSIFNKLHQSLWPHVSSAGLEGYFNDWLLAVNEATVQFHSMLRAQKWEFVSRKWSVMWFNTIYSWLIWGSSFAVTDRSYVEKREYWVDRHAIQIRIKSKQNSVLWICLFCRKRIYFQFWNILVHKLWLSGETQIMLSIFTHLYAKY